MSVGTVFAIFHSYISSIGVGSRFDLLRRVFLISGFAKYDVFKLYNWLGPYEEFYPKVQNKMATARLGFEICTLTTTPERADVGDGPNPVGDGRATGQLLMGSKVITVSMCKGSPRGRARNERDPRLTRNRFKTNDLWKEVRLKLNLAVWYSHRSSGDCYVISCRRHYVLCHGVEFFKRPLT